MYRSPLKILPPVSEIGRGLRRELLRPGFPAPAAIQEDRAGAIPNRKPIAVPREVRDAPAKSDPRATRFSFPVPLPKFCSSRGAAFRILVQVPALSRANPDWPMPPLPNRAPFSRGHRPPFASRPCSAANPQLLPAPAPSAHLSQAPDKRRCVHSPRSAIPARPHPNRPIENFSEQQFASAKTEPAH